MTWHNIRHSETIKENKKKLFEWSQNFDMHRMKLNYELTLTIAGEDKKIYVILWMQNNGNKRDTDTHIYKSVEWMSLVKRRPNQEKKTDVKKLCTFNSWQNVHILHYYVCIIIASSLLSCTPGTNKRKRIWWNVCFSLSWSQILFYFLYFACLYHFNIYSIWYLFFFFCAYLLPVLVIVGLFLFIFAFLPVPRFRFMG